MLLQREPVLVTTLRRSQIAAILMFTEAVLAVLVRSKVTSPATSGTSVTSVTSTTPTAAVS
jgi:hypothetical protein